MSVGYIAEDLHFERGPLKKVTYSNGLVFLHHRSRGYKSGSLYAWTGGGPREENIKNQGVCHLLEHMFFKGTKGFQGQECVVAMESMGAELNAFTSKEYIQFEVECLGQRLKQIFPIFLRMLFFPSFPDEEIPKEKKVIIQELKEEKDDNEVLLEEKFFEKGYSFSLGHSIGGNLTTVRGLTKKSLLHFWRKNFVNERLVISMVSDEDPQFYIDFLQLFFMTEGLDKQADPWRITQKSKSTPLRAGKSVMRKKCESSMILLGYSGPTLSAPERFQYTLLDHLLTDGLSSLLFKELREKRGLVYGLSSAISSFSDGGSFDIFASTGHKKLLEVKQVVLDVMGELVVKGPSEEDLARYKRQIVDYWETVFDDVSERNSYIGFSELMLGGISPLKNYAQNIKEVDVSQVKLLLKKKFQKPLLEVSLTSL